MFSRDCKPLEHRRMKSWMEVYSALREPELPEEMNEAAEVGIATSDANSQAQGSPTGES
jgi:hypothetical protein